MDWKYLNLAKYAALAGKSKLILTHIETQNKWHLTIHIELDDGFTVNKEIRFNSGELARMGVANPNWDNMQKLSEEISKIWIGRLNSMTEKCCNILNSRG